MATNPAYIKKPNSNISENEAPLNRATAQHAAELSTRHAERFARWWPFFGSFLWPNKEMNTRAGQLIKENAKSGRYTISITRHPLDIYGHFEKHHMIDYHSIVQVLSTKSARFFLNPASDSLVFLPLNFVLIISSNQSQ